MKRMTAALLTLAALTLLWGWGEAESGFFSSEKYQDRFYRLWEELARNFCDPENVAFELLNEVTDASFIDAWNRISAACIARIRPIAPKSLILIGSYHNKIDCKLFCKCNNAVNVGSTYVKAFSHC